MKMKIASSVFFRRYSTTSNYLMVPGTLYWQVSPLKKRDDPVIQRLDQFVQEGGTVNKYSLYKLVQQLSHKKQFNHALQVYDWMSDKGYALNLDKNGVSEAATRLELIFRAHGAEKAESYFNNFAPELKCIATYKTLLNCYVRSNSVEKAEATMQKMKDLGFERSKLPYPSLLSLYQTTGEKDREEALSREMKELGVWTQSDFSYFIPKETPRRDRQAENRKKMLLKQKKSDEREAARQKAEKEKVENAEKRFNSIAPECRDAKTYAVLLNCYVRSNFMEKAEATVQEMKDLGFITEAALSCNAVLNFYSQTGDYRKFNALVHEMEENRFRFGKSTLGTILNCYAKACDIAGLNKTLQLIESSEAFPSGWKPYLNAANAFMKAGDPVKALAMLKESEEQVWDSRTDTAYYSFLSLYACLGRKDDVVRICQSRRKQGEPLRRSLAVVLPWLLKAHDIEAVDQIVNEWYTTEHYFDTCDFYALDLLVCAYCKKGLIEKAHKFVLDVGCYSRFPDSVKWRRYWWLLRCVGSNDLVKAVFFMRRLSVEWRGLNPSGCLAGSLEYLKHKGDVEWAGEFLGLLLSDRIVSADGHERLLSYVKDSKSTQNQSALDIIQEEGGLIPYVYGQKSESTEEEEDAPPVPVDNQTAPPDMLSYGESANSKDFGGNV